METNNMETSMDSPTANSLKRAAPSPTASTSSPNTIRLKIPKFHLSAPAASPAAAEKIPPANPKALELFLAGESLPLPPPQSTPPPCIYRHQVLSFHNAEFLERQAIPIIGRARKTIKQIIASESFEGLEKNPRFYTYMSIQAEPSSFPSKHYCDFTGLPAYYTEPNTRLRYYNKSIYQLIKSLQWDKQLIDRLLILRGVKTNDQMIK